MHNRKRANKRDKAWSSSIFSGWIAFVALSQHVSINAHKINGFSTDIKFLVTTTSIYNTSASSQCNKSYSFEILLPTETSNFYFFLFPDFGWWADELFCHNCCFHPTMCHMETSINQGYIQSLVFSFYFIDFSLLHNIGKQKNAT